MGISADIVQCKNEIIDIKDLYNYNTKTICYIGGRHVFKDNVLDDYKNNQGCFTLKKGWNYIVREKQEVIKRFFLKKYKTEFIYLIDREDWYVILNY